LIKKGIGYQKVENCFLDVSDFVAAQELFMEQLQLNWPKMLDEFAYKINPLYKEFKEHHGLEYYWTTHQSEWATDIVFQSREELQLYKLISPICVPTEYNNRRARALRPWEKSDSDIFHIIGNGDFILNGVRQ